jgi:hypothetical protein
MQPCLIREPTKLKGAFLFSPYMSVWKLVQLKDKKH